jgi:hypothetical protein
MTLKVVLNMVKNLAVLYIISALFSLRKKLTITLDFDKNAIFA